MPLAAGVFLFVWAVIRARHTFTRRQVVQSLARGRASERARWGTEVPSMFTSTPLLLRGGPAFLTGSLAPSGVSIGTHPVRRNVFAIQGDLAQRGDLRVMPAVGVATY